MATPTGGPTVVDIKSTRRQAIDKAMRSAWRAEARLTLARDTLVGLDVRTDDRADEAVAMVSEAIDAYTAATARLDAVMSR